MRYARAFAITLALGLAYGCGNDPADDCAQLLDAFARAWERCGRKSYDAAKKDFTNALPCSTVKNSNPDLVEQCENDLNNLNGAACDSVKNGGTFPASCMGALAPPK